ncbi:hypothetical protein [Legionella lansingensis]|nr:hypothetical protein [Legionella lansingensis]
MPKLLHFIMMASLVLFTIKPLLLLYHDHQKQASPQAQYTVGTKCSGRTTTTLSYCQSSHCYVLAENAHIDGFYLFILSGLLFFVYTQLTSSSPRSRLFKPPICLH